MSILEIRLCKDSLKDRAHSFQEREVKFPAHVLILIWGAMVAACFLFWIGLLRFLLWGL